MQRRKVMRKQLIDFTVSTGAVTEEKEGGTKVAMQDKLSSTNECKNNHDMALLPKKAREEQEGEEDRQSSGYWVGPQRRGCCGQTKTVNDNRAGKHHPYNRCRHNLREPATG